MSGRMFKNANVVVSSPVSKHDCERIVAHLEEKIGFRLIPFGSTCISPWSGDVDVIAECEDKEAVWNALCENFEHVRRVGSMLSILYPHEHAGYVQVDVVPSCNPEDDAWSLSGGRPGGFKGRYRNIILGYLAKRVSEKTGYKVTFASPGGLGQTGKDRASDPAKILDHLCIPCDPEMAMSFEGIVESLVSSGQADRLVGFDDYIRNPKDYMPEQTERVISYVNAILLDN